MNTSEEHSEDIFLSQWLEGKRTDEQLQKLVSRADFEAYLQLRDTLGLYQVLDPDMEQQYNAIQTKIGQAKEEKPVRNIPLYVYFSVAASLLLFIGLYQLFFFSNVEQTGFGTTAIFSLSDGSKVTLNAKSKLEYPTLFAYNRNLKLQGEAFFEVQKGSKFTVNTNQGKVEVLGTQFSVTTFDDFFEVSCYEGRVKVFHNNQIEILTRGESVRFFNRLTETWHEKPTPTPDWIHGESTFRNTPLLQVIRQFENQYHCQVQYEQALKSIRFTGSFTNKNKQTALQSICIPLQLHYKETNNGNITIAE